MHAQVTSASETADGLHRGRRLRAGAALLVVFGGASIVAILSAQSVRSTALAAGPAPQVDARPHAVAAESARPVRIVVTGDITLGRTPVLPGAGARGLLAGVSPLLRRADIAVGNLETTLTNADGSKCAGSDSGGCFAFRAPPEYARDLRHTGFDVLSVANNHAWDYGEPGQAETIAALRAARLRDTGRPGDAAILRVRNGVRVAVLGFAPYPWAEDLRELETVRQAVSSAAQRADLVVVTMHAGAEGTDATHVTPGRETYMGEDRGDVVAFAHAAVDAGADLVAGHGPHVVRGLEWYRGRLIAYSLGNLSSHETLATDGILGVAAALDVRLRRDGSWHGGRLVPLRLVDGGRPVVDRSGAAVSLARRLSRSDFGRRGAAITASGTLAR